MIRLLAILGLAVLGSPAWSVQCRLALALAMDVSVSVDATEDTLQRQGLAAALIAPEVQDAFFASDLPVALAVYEWSGRADQRIILDWQLINDMSDLYVASSQIHQSTRSDDGSATAMGHALTFGVS